MQSSRPASTDPGALRLARLRHGQRTAELTLEQLWLRYFAVGGDVGLVELEAYLAGLVPLPSRQLDLLAQAVNEALDDLLHAARIPYSHAAAGTPDAAAALSASAALLTGSGFATPDQLPALTSAAYRALGVEAVVYLVDHALRLLVPVVEPVSAGPAGRPEPPVPHPMAIDSTLAGRAFRRVETIAGEDAGGHRLWLPLLDGVERLGVLEARLASPAGAFDDALRQQCEHLAGLLGHLVASVGERGDALDAVRRTRPRAPSAELVWRLLPPPDAETDTFTVSGWVAPADDAGGDVFDYALSSDCASLAVFDAMGHGLPAGLMAAAAVSAYRAARRDGQDLLGQAQAIDGSVSAAAPDAGFVTGFLGELDLVTGHLRYLSAGHPQPLVLRGGRVVRALAGGRRLPFGLGLTVPGPTGPADGDGQQPLGREDLEPGDWLVVHTDGVTEARDAAGRFFGDARLVDVLHNAAAAGHPPPETARRLAHAVLAHQHGQLQDDATVLLSRWQPRAAGRTSGRVR